MLSVFFSFCSAGGCITKELLAVKRQWSSSNSPTMAPLVISESIPPRKGHALAPGRKRVTRYLTYLHSCRLTECWHHDRAGIGSNKRAPTRMLNDKWPQLAPLRTEAVQHRVRPRLQDADGALRPAVGVLLVAGSGRGADALWPKVIAIAVSTVLARYLNADGTQPSPCSGS